MERQFKNNYHKKLWSNQSVCTVSHHSVSRKCLGIHHYLSAFNFLILLISVRAYLNRNDLTSERDSSNMPFVNVKYCPTMSHHQSGRNLLLIFSIKDLLNFNHLLQSVDEIEE
ncbi:hypothetical protein LOAG_07110 [Loa loa]|uniref:Uncharacterized protein n=1 Tax=Loa loa TaxID=7209 RepID=A0A1S0TWI2_LOALO|nr:hypothetical protein LOAG_07110 [Loa loa]EFO21379.1 hypothetical protein LOAG_07110 [Loa loa]